ncbi:uncharacterized protein LOC112564458 [Pomacea canaliculata]|uniref:uncharacterized protein LOC112564458 n=1 Tax=Pomacea canaliculata TaxID=400727 RepID=UPI000D73B8FA|nr:uncharacterized protein LOC112564458 [Pomacea canaliculata]
MRTRRTVRRASLLSLWFCIVTLPWQPCKGSNASSGQRLGFDGCTWVTDSGGTIDLSSLGLTNGKPRFLDVPGPDNFYYSYNPCYPFDEGNACVDAAVCQTDMSLYYQAGDASSPSLTEESGRPAILYQASREILRKTWVALICDTTASQPSLKALGDLGYGEYHLELTSVCACPDGCSGTVIDITIVIDVSIGTILDLVLVSLLMAYLMTGWCTTGSDTRPQVWPYCPTLTSGELYLAW